MEELISEWYDLDLSSSQKRIETLQTFGFNDIADKDDDFQYIIKQFKSHIPIRLETLQIGGIDFRVIKIVLYVTAHGGTNDK